MVTPLHSLFRWSCRITLTSALLFFGAPGLAGCTVDFTAPDDGCGNGRIDSGEACDDGNILGGDGCDEHCLGESGWQCFGQPSTCSTICGDGVTSGLETCDDGNPQDGDGCTALCAVEAGWWCLGNPSECAPQCGDDMLVGNEPCDGAVLSVANCYDDNDNDCDGLTDCEDFDCDGRLCNIHQGLTCNGLSCGIPP